MSSNKIALILRATGYRGKATISYLNKPGWDVHALVTDAKSDRAITLNAIGPREARIVLKLAIEADVQYVALKGSIVLNNPNAQDDYKYLSATPAVLDKGDVEKLVQASGKTWTLMRPGYSTSNLLPPLVHWMYPDIKEGWLFNSSGSHCVLILIDPDDIGPFIAAAFDDPAKFGGQIITLVGENMSFNDMMKQYSEACGYQFEILYRTPEETEKELANPFVSGKILCVGLKELVNTNEVPKWRIPLMSFKEILEKHKYELPKGPVEAGRTMTIPSADSGMLGSEKPEALVEPVKENEWRQA
ncbi:hypothetical protein BDU57DRAFT_534531 [Ampelomyces quisqualis]|uniref:NmrA-like domain-containing protein n=1 Tax=Ampelomyces quisqualis TaxID=50730 RepID=A0A6A5QYA5_AMPQU|nr:hypothetical protein BDU57DRAFT_534531 [Ampelomyces quisqualis]